MVIFTGLDGIERKKKQMTLLKHYAKHLSSQSRNPWRG